MHRSWLQRLLDWYVANRRDLPWRRRPTPYRVWISEIMLQQTRVETAIPYFERFVDRFPNVRELAAADLQEVLKLWEGLGYYARARNLHRAARMIVTERRGRIPRTSEELRTLPGIGPYAAAAIASIAGGEPVPAIDGNVMRVAARLWGIESPVDGSASRRTVRARLAPLMGLSEPAQLNQALMELGALVCRPAAPSCAACPLRRGCVAHRDARTGELPRRSPRRRVPHHEIAVGVIRSRGNILIARRPTDRMLGGLWEFPGGKRRDGESLVTAARREIFEETGLRVRVGNAVAVIDHAYSHFTIRLTAFECRVRSGSARPLASDEVRWVAAEELDDYPFPAANKKVIAAIRQIPKESPRRPPREQAPEGTPNGTDR